MCNRLYRPREGTRPLGRRCASRRAQCLSRAVLVMPGTECTPSGEYGDIFRLGVGWANAYWNPVGANLLLSEQTPEMNNYKLIQP